MVGFPWDAYTAVCESWFLQGEHYVGGLVLVDLAAVEGRISVDCKPAALHVINVCKKQAPPTAALDRARTSFLMPCAEDATAARLQSLSAVARGGGTASRATAGAAWAGSRT